MRLALGLIFTNELHWLKLHLPVYKDSFDGIVAITDPNTKDGSIEYINSITPPRSLSGFGSTNGVMIEPWQYNWGDFATKLANFAEFCGFDAIMRVDPDECLMPDAGHEIKRLLEEEASLVCFARYNFFNDRRHLWAGTFPDWQVRAWRLRRGIIVQGDKHEGVNFAQHDLHEDTLDPEHRYQHVTTPAIFHYGWGSHGGIYYQQTKYQSQAQVAAGGPPQVAWPADFQIIQYPTEPFDGPQPIDPDQCGLYAPYQE